jgi:NAD(P)H-hydrate epimerase
MKILSAEQVRAADRFTILNEPVASIDLMERAAAACFRWLAAKFPDRRSYCIVCGPGNNGGDGLALARMLHGSGRRVQVVTVAKGAKRSADFSANERRLKRLKGVAYAVFGEAPPQWPFSGKDVIVDALFGTGLAGAPEGIFASAIQAVNESKATVVAIDMPSGLFCDRAPAAGQPIVEAAHTLSFETPRLAFFFAGNAPYCGEVTQLPIGLDRSFIESLPCDDETVDAACVRTLLRPRPAFSHKGHFGHAAIVAGSYGKMGAAVLAVRACLRSGAGLTTAVVPACGYEIMQTAAPEAMCLTPSLADDANPMTVSGDFDPEAFTAIGIGPGLGVNRDAARALKTVLDRCRRPLVLDADALNILSENKDWLKKVPAGSVLTPHPKEFGRLAGASADDFDRHRRQRAFSMKHGVVVVLKGRYTCTSDPAGLCRFNTTGNPGLAKGGSGDALTGVITALLAQGLAPADAAVAGVYVHGLAGDVAVRKLHERSMLASDLVYHLGTAFNLFK